MQVLNFTKIMTASAAAVVLAGLADPPCVRAQGGMPNVAQMSGVPLPAGDLPDGVVSVRLVRGDISNNITDQPVELHGGPSVLSLSTDAEGRAVFSGVTPGTPVHAVTLLDGLRLETQTFPVPASGGIKVMLVAPDAEAARLAASEPQSGSVVLAAGTEFLVELDDDELQVYYLLQVANNAPTPVEPPQPLVFDLPAGARASTILEGSSPLASAAGPRLTVRGPFPPGQTVVQAAYRLPYGTPAVRITQPLPAALEQVSVIVQKVGAMHLESPQFASHGEMPGNGKTYFRANGPALAAGQSLDFTITGLPVRASWPHQLALALAVVILAAGIWVASRPSSESASVDARRKTLHGRRERLFGDLVRLEGQHGRGELDERRYATRREELVAQLVRIDSELDQDRAA